MIARIPGMEISLGRALVRRLRREARGDPSAFRQLEAEAVARRWLIRCGVPCWRSADPPGKDGRYSLLFADGSRALVGLTDCVRDFDAMARARCSWLVLVDLPRPASGSAAGFVHLLDPGFTGSTRLPDDLPPLLGRCRRVRLSLLLGSVRLLLLGEPVPPDPEPELPRGLAPGSGAVNR
jgi:hypothetical protein